MPTLKHDANGNTIQGFAPTDNYVGVTTLNIKDDRILAIQLPASASVKINNQGAFMPWPADIFVMSPDIHRLDFSSATNVLAMR